MTVAHLGTIAHLLANPFDQANALEIVEDGALLLDDHGIVLHAGERRQVLASPPSAYVVDHRGAWIIPGLVDGHAHFPQYFATAALGHGLLDWLDRSVFPVEASLQDPETASAIAERFVRRLLEAGTTTAAAFGSQFLWANEALFDAADRFGLRLIAGATLMDCGAPANLLQTPEQAYADACRLISRVNANPRLEYAVAPRFALSCGEGMLEMCGHLLRAFPECYLQTHINESIGEIEAVRRKFPWSNNYLEVYDRYGLLTEKALFAHSIHTSEVELERLSAANCAVCHCPTSNLFLGSGLFPLAAHRRHGLRMAVGTDIGAGTRFSVWEELSECYKVQRLQGLSLRPGELLYLATLGGAEALGLARETGNFRAGMNGDFCVISLDEDAYLRERLERCETLEDRLFCLIHLASAHHVKETYVRGMKAAQRGSR